MANNIIMKLIYLYENKHTLADPESEGMFIFNKYF